jgi:D-beta-D-heptose 7-phosphate kinase / D-beta-D-heptose 1-phosphate adenosyltransferase
MRRVIFLSGWQGAPRLPDMREYSLVLLPPSRGPRTSPAGWRERAAGLGAELDASWLIQRDGAEPAPAAVRGLFRGCRDGVGDAALARTLARLDAEASRSRVVTDFPTVARRVDALRRAGKSIVFTNGVFDLFHVGHLHLLGAARAEGDALLVGINSDESARRLKGRSRPVVPQFARAEVVAATRGVDLCVVFDQDDPLQLLRVVRPDVLVKGSEYALEEVVGRRLVAGWGGRVHLVPHLAGWSTSDMIRRLRESRA